MKLDKQNVRQKFKEYTRNYNVNDPKVALKIKHTYHVADLSERIALSEGLDSTGADLAWLIGMLHDIGRFEQLRRFDTFNDSQSVDHAGLGADLLFGRDEDFPMIREFVSDSSEDRIAETAIRVHSAYRVPENLSPRCEMYCHILRDADKLDILRANIETPLEEIYNVTADVLYHADLTDAVVESFYEHHATLRSIKRTPVDHIAAHISLLFELVYKESVRIAIEQGYWEKLADFPSKNPSTRKKLSDIKEEMRRYLYGRAPK